jgi:hypothetical protein
LQNNKSRFASSFENYEMKQVLLETLYLRCCLNLKLVTILDIWYKILFLLRDFFKVTLKLKVPVCGSVLGPQKKFFCPLELEHVFKFKPHLGSNRVGFANCSLEWRKQAGYVFSATSSSDAALRQPQR